jgi:opacity protein-like surface antigen
MRLGFEYGFGEDFNLGVGRSTFLKTYDGFAKYRVARQSETFPFTIVASAEGAIPTIRNYFPGSNDNFSDKFSGALQIHLARAFNNFGAQLSPGFLNTGYLLSENTSYSMFTLGMGASVRLSKKVSANLEYLHSFKDEFDNTKPLSLGVDIDTGGHLFQLILSNSQRMFGTTLYTHTTGDWGNGNLYFGFNLIREFRIKYY